MYDDLIVCVDAADNGISACPNGAELLYVDHTTLSARIGALNPGWNDAYDDAQLATRFSVAVSLARDAFLNTLRYLTHSWIPAGVVVKQAYVLLGALVAADSFVQV